MAFNRISRIGRWQESSSQSVAVMAPQGFVVCSGVSFSGGSSGWSWQQELFRLAYELARANRAMRLEYHHRFFSNWN
jgi:hypothetical protein